MINSVIEAEIATPIILKKLVNITTKNKWNIPELTNILTLILYFFIAGKYSVTKSMLRDEKKAIKPTIWSI